MEIPSETDHERPTPRKRRALRITDDEYEAESIDSNAADKSLLKSTPKMNSRQHNQVDPRDLVAEASQNIETLNPDEIIVGEKKPLKYIYHIYFIVLNHI
jgi:hypothetical protein